MRRRRYTPKHQATRPTRTKERRALASLLSLLGGLLFLLVLGGVLFLQAWPPAAVVRSDSMAPGIEVGDIVIMRSLGGRAPRVGDIVEVNVPARAQREFSYPPRVTHRIVSIEDDMLTIKGDAFDEPDPFTVPAASVKTEVVAVLPFAGRAVAFLTSPLGLMWLGIGAAIFFIAPLHDLRRQPAVAPASEDLGAIRSTVDQLVFAVGEYGQHLRSHTAVVQDMSVASRDLATVAARLEEAIPPPAPEPPSPPPAPPTPDPPTPDPPTPELPAVVTITVPAAVFDLLTFGETRRTVRRLLGSRFGGRGGPAHPDQHRVDDAAEPPLPGPGSRGGG